MMNRMIALLVFAAAASPVLAAEGANPFAGTVYQAVAAAVVFVVVLVVLKRFAWSKILQGLQDRENKIKGDLQHAEQAAHKAADTLKEYQAQLATAQGEARKIIEQSRADAQKLAAQQVDQTQQQITQLRQRAEQEIQTAKEQAVSEIYAEAATLATTVAGKILQREIRPEDHAQAVEQSLAEMAKASEN